MKDGRTIIHRESRRKITISLVGCMNVIYIACRNEAIRPVYLNTLVGKLGDRMYCHLVVVEIALRNSHHLHASTPSGSTKSRGIVESCGTQSES